MHRLVRKAGLRNNPYGQQAPPDALRYVETGLPTALDSHFANRNANFLVNFQNAKIIVRDDKVEKYHMTKLCK